MEEIKTVHPFVKWAQRRATVYLTIDARDLAEENRSINLTPEGLLTFRGKNKQGDVEYLREIALHGDVSIEESKWKVTDFCIQFSISKADKDGEFWPRLCKEAGKLQWLSCDWDRWADESDEEATGADVDFGDMQGFGEDEEEEDSDEEEAPEDEEEKQANIEDLGV
jgi:prostaglandin-E synthase